jgi:hypothetical protein
MNAFVHNLKLFICLCNIANAYKSNLPGFAFGPKKRDYIQAVRDALITYCPLKLYFPITKHDLDEYWEMTPGNGFCFFLMHYQARLCFLKNGGNGLDKLPASFQYYSKEFKSDLDLEINHIREKLHLNAYVNNGFKKDDEDLLKRLEHLKSYISDEGNIVEKKNYKNIELSVEDRVFTWGNCLMMGRIFLDRNSIPFAFFTKDGTNDNPNAKFHSFSLNQNVTEKKYSDIYQMIVACEKIGYIGFFDGNIHFHLLPKPPLTADDFTEAINGIAFDLAELFFRVDTTCARTLYNSVLHASGMKETVDLSMD